MVEIKNLTKIYKLNKKQMAESHTKDPYKRAVDGLSLTAKPGEIYGLLGPNGAGKTTTLRCISTIIKPTEGQIYVDGHEVQEEPEEVQRRIGFLTSDIKLDEQFDPDYMFRFFGRLHKVPEDMLEKRRQELFSYFGIEEFAHKRIKELSTGMKQKAAIAVSLVHDPEIIIFDEPTRGIDVGAKAEIYKLMNDYVAQGKAIIMISSEMPEAMGMSDRIIVLSNHKMSGELSREEFSQKSIMKMAMYHM